MKTISNGNCSPRVVFVSTTQSVKGMNENWKGEAIEWIVLIEMHLYRYECIIFIRIPFIKCINIFDFINPFHMQSVVMDSIDFYGMYSPKSKNDYSLDTIPVHSCIFFDWIFSIGVFGFVRLLWIGASFNNITMPLIERVR